MDALRAKTRWLHRRRSPTIPVARSASETYNPVRDKALPISPHDGQIVRARSEDAYASPQQPSRMASAAQTGLPPLPLDQLMDMHNVNEPPPPTPPKASLDYSEAAGHKRSTSSTRPIDRVILSPTITMSPQERARRRMEAEMRQRREEEEALRQEEARQARLKAEKEELLRRDAEDERRRRAMLERDVQQSVALRRQKEERERQEAEAWARELEERRREEKERRLEHGRRGEALRREEQARLEEAARIEAEARRQTERKRAQAKADARKLRKQKKGSHELILGGWLTVQTDQTPVWKRRYFQLTPSSLKLYKTDEDLSQPLDEIDLDGRVQAVREWHEGFEELEAIPHSFAILLSNGQGSMSMFTNTDDEKDTLMGFLSSSI